MRRKKEEMTGGSHNQINIWVLHVRTVRRPEWTVREAGCYRHPRRPAAAAGVLLMAPAGLDWPQPLRSLRCSSAAAGSLPSLYPGQPSMAPSSTSPSQPPLLATAFGAALPNPARALLGASVVRLPAFCRCCSPPTPLTSQNRAVLVCTPIAVVVAVKVNVVSDLDQDERLHNSPQLHQHSLSKHTLDSPHAIDLGHLCPTFPDTTSAAACCLPLPTSPLRPCYHRSTQQLLQMENRDKLMTIREHKL
ncbi:hypothetical protein PVAP13_6KG300306 [Panicum virgatum]|uniref:Uncharacterized protein n=1 Tax=Panicum virgatum TaxID=38727 RepID=A0A8T0RHQ1_PANVG|nr:hypothetical protein PVAP13_6KG300306 [Panicum virgatum]